MWIPVKMWGSNIGPLEDFEYTFQEGCTIIQSYNHDDDGQIYNGAGKSIFIDVPAIATTGSSSTDKKSLRDIINWDEEVKSMTVGILYYNSITESTMEIQRVIHKTKSELLTIKIDGEVPNELPTKRATEDAVDVKLGNAFILEQLGISKEDLFSRYFISGHKYESFFQITGGAKQKLLDSLVDTDKVDKAIATLESEIELWIESKEETDKLVFLSTTDIERNKEKIESIRSGEEAKKFESEKAAEIDDLIDQKEKNDAKWNDLQYNLNSIDEDLKEYKSEKNEILERIKLFEGKLDSLQAKFDSENTGTFPDEHLVERYNDQLDSLSSQERKVKKEYTDASSLLEELEQMKQGAVTCPNCSHEFLLNENFDLRDIDQYIKEAELIKEDLEIKLSAIKDDIAGINYLLAQKNEQRTTFYDNQKKKLDEILVEIEDVEEELSILNTNRGLNQKDLNRLEEASMETISSIDKLAKSIQINEKSLLEAKEREFNNFDVKVHEKALHKAEDDLELYTNDLNNIQEEIDKRKQWIIYYNDLKFTIMNKRINSIAQRVNYYLQENDSDLSVRIEGFKENKDGSRRQEFTPMIYRNWLNPQVFSQFSGGERVRLNLAGDLAFQEITDSYSHSGGLFYYQNDEVLNSSDPLGIENAAKAFNKMKKPMLLVTHTGTDSINYDKRVIIEKRNGKSKIVV